jgi:hypothetical protein
MYEARHAARHVAVEVPQMLYNEHDVTTPEFISPESAQQLVVAAMKARVEPSTGRLLPLEEKRTLVGGPGYTIKPLPSIIRHDIVLPGEPQTYPYADGGKLKITHEYSTQGELYSMLINEQEVTLGADDVERLNYDRAELEWHVDSRRNLKRTFGEAQTNDAYYIDRTDSPPSNSDGLLVSPVRVYMPAGIHGMQTMSRLMEADADFASAKIWVPHITHGRQAFRHDTPIVTAHTVSQLRSVVNAVRAVASKGFGNNHKASPVGIPIEGAPGAFAAQPADGSFNGDMSRFWAEPIITACNTLPLQVGEVVTQEWVDEAARRAAAMAQAQAASAGIHPAHHALVVGQDAAVVMDAIHN